jgi:hypothetical protein
MGTLPSILLSAILRLDCNQDQGGAKTRFPPVLMV